MTGRQSWLRGLPRIAAAVECGGSTHHVIWKRGSLALVDHDAEAERAVTALGGDRCECVDLYERWRRRCTIDDPAGELVAAAAGRESARAAERDRQRLPEHLRDLMLLIDLVRIERAGGERDRDHPLPAAIQKIMSRRVSDALRQSIGFAQRAGARTKVSGHFRALPIGEQPGVEISGDSRQLRLDLELPANWLVEVAGRDAAYIGGLLILQLRPPMAMALRWDVQGRRVVPDLVEAEVQRQAEQWVVSSQRSTRSGAFFSIALDDRR